MVRGPTAPKGTALPCASHVPTMIGMKMDGNSATTVASNDRPSAERSDPRVTIKKEKNPLQQREGSVSTGKGWNTA